MTEAPKKLKIAVIGAGMMGQGCAQQFAASGHHVVLQSLDDQLFRSVLERIRADLVFLVERGVGCMDEVEATVARITTTSQLDEALEGAGFVLECIFEDSRAKRELFHEMDGITSPDVILATNTSVIRITEIAEACAYRDRVIGAHWWNPPFLMPLVEVVPGAETSAATIETTMGLLLSLGKSPVLLRKDFPGFVGNRLLLAVLREATFIVDQGVADPGTVDMILKLGPGRRWPVLGPFEQADMVGLDLTLSVQQYLLKHLDNSREPSPSLREKVAKRELGFKTGGNGFEQRTAEEMTAIRANLLDFLVRQAAAAGSGTCPGGATVETGPDSGEAGNAATPTAWPGEPRGTAST